MSKKGQRQRRRLQEQAPPSGQKPSEKLAARLMVRDKSDL